MAAQQPAINHINSGANIMTRLHTLQVTEATGDLAGIFSNIKKAVGMVPNAYATIGSQSPDALLALLSMDQTIGKGSLTKAEIETIKLVVSEIAGCDYCVAAHTLIGKMAGLPLEVTKQIRLGAPTGDAKRDALVKFVRKIQFSVGTLAAEDLAEFLGAGFTQKQVVEVSFVISAITFTNLVNRINDTVIDFPAVS